MRLLKKYPQVFILELKMLLHPFDISARSESTKQIFSKAVRRQFFVQTIQARTIRINRQTIVRARHLLQNKRIQDATGGTAECQKLYSYGIERIG